MFTALFVKKGIFAYLTLKLTFWPWRWPYVIKIIQEIDCPDKITLKWGITLVPGFTCWKILFDLEISDDQFVSVPKKIRPRVPKWHPVDFCCGHPIVSESIIKHRPYRETRFRQNPLDYSTIIVLRHFLQTHLNYQSILYACPRKCWRFQNHEKGKLKSPWHAHYFWSFTIYSWW